MGCGESKIDHKEDVLQCRIHEYYLKKVISSRNAFSDAHFAYAMSLRKLGMVLSDYRQSENCLLFGNVENTSNLSQVFDQLDYHFFKGFESAYNVSKFLEPTSMSHLSNSVDINRQFDHSPTPVISSNWSSKHLKCKYEESDDPNSNQSKTYAVILNKMLVLQKKLYEEVKANELMKIEHQRKVALLNKQQKRVDTDEKTLEKTKAVARYSCVRYIVRISALDFTVSEINRLQEKQLYPKLLELADAMAQMWQTMYKHHKSQLTVAVTLKMISVSISTKDRGYQHLERTQRLVNELSEWHVRLVNIIKYQRQHVQALNKWINLIPIITNLKENASSNLQIFVREWHDLLEKVSNGQVLSALHTLIEVIKGVQILQEDVMRMKEKCDDTKREHKRKSCEFDAWYRHLKENSTNEGAELDNVVEEWKEEVESLQRKLKEEEVLFEHACKYAREKSIQILKTHLPELFRALCKFSNDCLEMYLRLRSIRADDAEGNLNVD